MTDLIDRAALREALEPYTVEGYHPQYRRGVSQAVGFIDAAPAIACKECECEVDPCQVTNDERHETCGTSLAKTMTDDLQPLRPHAYGWQLCLDCRSIHMAVWPVWGRPVLQECPACGHMACIPFPHADGLSHDGRTA